MKYSVIEIFTSEQVHWKGLSLYEAIVKTVRDRRLAARCLVTRGIAGCYENGEIASHHVLDLSHNMPLKIEIILPVAELDSILPAVEEMVSDGIVVVEDMDIRSHRTARKLLPHGLRVRDVMSASPVSLPPDAPASEAARLLLTSEFNGLPVADEAGEVLGMITQRDLIERAGMPLRLGLLAELDKPTLDTHLQLLETRTVGEIMSKPPVTVRDDQQLAQAVDTMVKKRLKRIPVVDKQGQLVGMLSRIDVFRIVAHAGPDWHAFEKLHNIVLSGDSRVGRATLHDLPTVPPDAPLAQVFEAIDNETQRVAVVDEDGKLVGIVSDRELLALFKAGHPGLLGHIVNVLHLGEGHLGEGQKQGHEIDESTFSGRTAGDVMRADLITISEDAPLDEAVKLMTEHRLKRLPVIAGNGKYAGMLSREALLRTVVEP